MKATANVEELSYTSENSGAGYLSTLLHLP
jgi:hypothetical protein